MKELFKELAVNHHGIFNNVDADIYHSLECPGVSNSKLELVSRGLNYLKNAQKVTTNKEMLTGQLIHDAILLPHVFDTKYVFSPKFDKRTKKGKEDSVNFYELHSNKQIIEDCSRDQILKIRDIVLNHPVVKNLLSEGAPEVSAFWIDQDTSIKCKARYDWLRDDGIIIDIKTIDDSRSFNFQKSIVYRNYDRCAAFYLDGASSILKKEYKTFIYIVVERSEPYEIAIYNLDSDSIEFGRSLYKRELNKLKSFLPLLESNHEEIVYNTMIETISTPYWARNLESR